MAAIRQSSAVTLGWTRGRKPHAYAPSLFIHAGPRQGLGRRLYAACAGAARNAGFREFELMATRPGEPLYEALGFSVVERVVVTLPGGVDVPFARMHRAI
jgi:predicted N-acetyltransferase YhbS